MSLGDPMHLAVIVLAAGKGTRMKSDLPKVLHNACGRSLLGWALATAEPLEADETVVVVGHGADDVVASLPDGAIGVVQEPQLGTGDAARVGFGACTPDADTVLVILGDMPLLRPPRSRRSSTPTAPNRLPSRSSPPCSRIQPDTGVSSVRTTR